MKHHGELSKATGTIGNVIAQNKDKIDCTTSLVDLVNVCKSLLADSNNSDKDNFITTLTNKKTWVKGIEYVYNYMLKGDNLGVI